MTIAYQVYGMLGLARCRELFTLLASVLAITLTVSFVVEAADAQGKETSEWCFASTSSQNVLATRAETSFDVWGNAYEADYFQFLYINSADSYKPRGEWEIQPKMPLPVNDEYGDVEYTITGLQPGTTYSVTTIGVTQEGKILCRGNSAGYRTLPAPKDLFYPIQ